MKPQLYAIKFLCGPESKRGRYADLKAGAGSPDTDHAMLMTKPQWMAWIRGVDMRAGGRPRGYALEDLIEFVPVDRVGPDNLTPDKETLQVIETMDSIDN